MGFSQRTVTLPPVALTSSGLDGDPGSSRCDGGGGGNADFDEDEDDDSTTVSDADHTA